MKAFITKDVAFCRQLLKGNKMVAIPTETVYGLAANAFSEKAVKGIFEMKGRPRFNPLILHIHSLEQLHDLAVNVPQKALKLAKTFRPGSLTLILPKNDKVPDIVTAGKPTVGVRMPNHPLTLELLRGLPFPVAAPSANPFTRVSPTSAEHVASYFEDRIPAILDGGPCEVGLESTIVGFDRETPIVYRKGGISIESIEEVTGNVVIQTKNKQAPEAPGMLLKHYSPRTKLVLTDNIIEVIQDYEGKKVGVLSFYRSDFPKVELIIPISPKGNLDEAAQHLFSVLHQMDEYGLDVILAERFPDEGLGRSINDRLERAAN